MYKAIARRKARATFDAISPGDWESAIEDVADDVHHVFPGNNAIGGERPATGPPIVRMSEVSGSKRGSAFRGSSGA